MILQIQLIFILIVIGAGLIYFFRRLIIRDMLRATSHLEELNREYLKKEQEINRLLEETKEKGKVLLSEAELEAQKIKAQIFEEAEKERRRIIQEAKNKAEEIIEQAEKSRKLLLTEIETRINQEAVNKSLQLIRYILPEYFLKELHLYWLEEFFKEDFTNLSNLRIPPEINEAKIITAFSLSDKSRNDLAKRLKELLGRDFVLKEEIDLKLLGGIVVEIGSLVLDGSLKHKLNKEAKKLLIEKSSL